MMTSSNGTIFHVTSLLVLGIHRWPVNSPHKLQGRGALMLSLICPRTNGWVNNRDAGDLKRHRAHLDVAVIVLGNKVVHITNTRSLWRHHYSCILYYLIYRLHNPGSFCECAQAMRDIVTSLHCNVALHWLGAFTQWSMHNTLWYKWIIDIRNRFRDTKNSIFIALIDFLISLNKFNYWDH